jgi:23S rRNA (uridine2552-2'-O)-methyltransferase
VLLERVADRGRVVGVDVEEIEPIEGVTFLCLDFTEPDAPALIAQALGGPADAVLSDAAPKLTGIRDVDRGAHEELCQAALAVAESLLAKGGALVVKGFPGPEADAFRRRLRERFGKVSEVRPEGKRSTSKEFYWVATPFRGPAADQAR